MADIPLSTVRSNVSVSGARKPMAGVSTGYDSSSPVGNEKMDLQQRGGGRRRRMGDGLGRTGTGGSDDVRMNALGRLYAKIVGFSVVTRYMVYVVPIGILLAAPLVVLALTGHKDDIPVGNYQKKDTKEVVIGPPLFRLFLWILISWLSLWVAKIAAWFLPKIFMFFCGIVSKGVRKYATVLQNLTISLSLFFSALASWLTFKNLFQAANSAGVNWVVVIERILAACFASSAVLLAEKAIVQLIGVSYHQRSFANRIKASKREIYLLGLLYDASRTLFPMYCPEFAEEDYVINDSIEMMLRGKKGRKSAGAATPMKIIGDVSRFGDKVTSAIGNVAHEITGKQVLNPNSAHSIVLEALEKQLPSEALARRIWMSFVLEGKEALYIEDFQEVLGPAYRDEAEEAFNAIDGDMNGDISLDEMTRKVVEIGRERKAIGEGMKDIGQALRVFDKILLFIVLLVVIFIFLFFFNSSYITVIGTAGTALLSLSFVFGTTTQEFLGSCIFLFVKHPYDVGDRVDIDKVQMVVERISLLYTVFTRIDRMQVVQVPNIGLNTLWIDNISRSKAMKETFQVNVDFGTTFEDIELLRVEMETFVRASENARDFQPDFTISVGGVGNLDKMILNITIKHKSNWHNESVRANRRSKFMCALALALKKIPINGPGGGGETLGGPTNPSYSVAVSDQFAAAARAEAAKEKDESRLVPIGTGQTGEQVREMEQNAATELNAHNLSADTHNLWDYRDQEVRSATPSNMRSDEHRRSRDIENVRSDLMQRASTRGRRRAGEGLQNMTPTESRFGPTSPITSGSRLETFDEEAQIGAPAPYSGGQASAEGEDERAGLYPSASQRSQRGPQQGQDLSYKGSRGLTGHR
ncbi:hypothetical protein HIM_05578 [Hirsutella minnesotensis 3608]|uniref:Mechanosensitive ion channel protein n=1 Tax=Hirsutella minnesotensis 3608 TaxID=1043627 RepID=A0A0F8A061_9HYPO|nr:hypothetical protein HIM_05578 [Hirsutella minnesotensis 3608]